jgi:hypothetical protein
MAFREKRIKIAKFEGSRRGSVEQENYTMAGERFRKRERHQFFKRRESFLGVARQLSKGRESLLGVGRWPSKGRAPAF